MSITAVLENRARWHVEPCDVLAGLALLPAASVHCICTSPPYLGLRDYGIAPRQWPDGLVCCYGLEPDVASYVRHTVLLFEEFRRVLRDDGVIWWNLGDSYSSNSKFGGATSGKHVSALHGADAIPSRKNRIIDRAQGSKLLIPHRVAIGLADAGWIIRQDNVWGKRNPMAESVGGWKWRRCRGKSGVRKAESKTGFQAPLSAFPFPL